MADLSSFSDRLYLTGYLSRYIATKFLVDVLISDERLSRSQINTMFDEFVKEVPTALYYYYDRFFIDQHDKDEDKGINFLEDVKENAKKAIDGWEFSDIEQLDDDKKMFSQ